jgi:ATP-dependent Clp protease protease subunit
LETFLALHTPYAAELSPNQEPTEQEIRMALTRRGTPTWNEEDFQGLIHQLQRVGYGWLRPEGVRKQLHLMASERQGLLPLSNEQEKSHDVRNEKRGIPLKEERTPENILYHTEKSFLRVLESQLAGFEISPLLNNRILSIDTPIEDVTSRNIITQLLYLHCEDPTRDIHLHINSPGGSVYATLAIYDVIQFIQPQIATYCTGFTSGVAALLLATGSHGKRYAFPNSVIHIHPLSLMSSSGNSSQVTAREIIRLQQLLVKLFAFQTRQSQTTILQDIERGRYFTASSAILYGFIDQIIDSSQV